MIRAYDIEALPSKTTSRVVAGVCAVIVLTIACAATGQIIPLLAGIGLLSVASVLMPSLVVPLLLVTGVMVMPFAGNLSGDEQASRGPLVAFGLTDLFLFASLPGALRLFISQHRQILSALPRSARNYCFWALLFLIVCTVSFLANRHVMGTGLVSYAAGWFRTFQILVLLPFAFAVVAWKPRDFVWMWTGYVCSVLFFAFMVTVLYCVGAGTFPVFGVHKNIVGWLVASGMIVAVISLWDAPQKEPLIPRVVAETMLLFGMPALAASSSRISVICFLVGVAMLGVRYRRIKLPMLLMAALAASLWVGVLVTPKWARGLPTSFSLHNRSNTVRVEQYQSSLERFKANPLLGDGLRARKDIQPHNLEVLLLSETGISGIVTFAGVLIAVFMLFRDTLHTLPKESFATGTLCALTTFVVMIFVHAHTDPFWRRGPVLFLGAGIGICCALLRQNAYELQVSEA